MATSIDEIPPPPSKKDGSDTHEIVAPPDPPGEGIALSLIDHDYLAEAAAYLERPAFLVRVTNKLGRPTEALLRRLPAPASKIVLRSTDAALRTALRAALFSLPRLNIDSSTQSVRALHASTFQSGSLHSGATYITGFTGGMLGAVALPIELPATTVIMLRSIADIAQKMGTDLSQKEARLECLAVFGLGGTATAGVSLRASLDNGEAPESGGLETGYYAMRSSLTSATRAAAMWASTTTPQQLTEAMLRGKTTAVARLVATIAARFSVVVSQKTVLQLLPILGAATGTAANLAFIDHFNQVARYHFGMRLLERRSGAAVVRAAYEQAALALPAPK